VLEGFALAAARQRFGGITEATHRHYDGLLSVTRRKILGMNKSVAVLI
jgi:hypothetical protein